MYKTVDEKLLIELRCAFDLFDENGDGTLEPCELCSAVTSITNFGKNLSAKDMKEMMNFMGVTTNGEYLTFPDFVTLIVSKLRKAESEEELIEIFKIFDKKGLGKISSKEIQTVMEDIEEPITQQEIDDLMNKFDIDGDGCLNYDEFKAMMESR